MTVCFFRVFLKNSGPSQFSRPLYKDWLLIFLFVDSFFIKVLQVGIKQEIGVYTDVRLLSRFTWLIGEHRNMQHPNSPNSVILFKGVGDQRNDCLIIRCRNSFLAFFYLIFSFLSLVFLVFFPLRIKHVNQNETNPATPPEFRENTIESTPIIPAMWIHKNFLPLLMLPLFHK